MPIAFAGVLLYFFKPPGVTVDDNPLLPLYEVLMAFWAISFLTVRLDNQLDQNWPLLRPLNSQDLTFDSPFQLLHISLQFIYKNLGLDQDNNYLISLS